jgi:hypothetical protein
VAVAWAVWVEWAVWITDLKIDRPASKGRFLAALLIPGPDCGLSTWANNFLVT